MRKEICEANRAKAGWDGYIGLGQTHQDVGPVDNFYPNVGDTEELKKSLKSTA
jgi:hypothetical protein